MKVFMRSHSSIGQSTSLRSSEFRFESGWDYHARVAESADAVGSNPASSE